MISVEVEDFEGLAVGDDADSFVELVDRLMLAGEPLVFIRDGVPVAIMTPIKQSPEIAAVAGEATDTAVPAEAPPLTRDAPPEVIRLHLLDECRPTFDAQHEQMSDEQKEREGWHQRWLAHALLQSDRPKFWRLAHAMARREWPDMPDHVPGHVVRLIAGL